MQLMVLLPPVKINDFMMGSKDQRRLYCSTEENLLNIFYIAYPI